MVANSLSYPNNPYDTFQIYRKAYYKKVNVDLIIKKRRSMMALVKY